MTTEKMSVERFAAIVDAYGARADRWPVAERAAAEALVAASPEARRLLDAAAGLDRLLDASPAQEPSRALREAVLRAAPRRPLARPSLGWRGIAAALAASLLLGMVAGGTLGDEEPTDTGADLLQLAFLDDNRAGY